MDNIQIGQDRSDTEAEVHKLGNATQRNVSQHRATDHINSPIARCPHARSRVKHSGTRAGALARSSLDLVIGLRFVTVCQIPEIKKRARDFKRKHRLHQTGIQLSK